MSRKICSACSGSGYYDIFLAPPCGACDGTGEVEVKEIIAKENLMWYNRAAVEIVDELKGRSGMFEDIDSETEEEILEAIAKIITTEYNRTS